MRISGSTVTVTRPLLTVAFLVAGSAILIAHETKLTGATTAPLSPGPYKTATFINTAPPGATSPVFSHGYLIQFLHQPASQDQLNIFLYNATGQSADHALAVWPPKADALFISSVDVGAGDRLAVAGQAIMDDGSKIPFIATSDLYGKDARYFPTGTYLATRIALADDGSVWCVGAEHSEIRGTQRVWPNYSMLRHYSATGRLLDHLLPRWGADVAYIAAGISDGAATGAIPYDNDGKQVVSSDSSLSDYVSGYVGAWRARGETFLTIGGDNIYLLDQLSGRLYLYNARTNVLSVRYTSEGSPHSMVPTGFAVTANGAIFTSFRSDSAVNKTAVRLYRIAPGATADDVRWGDESQLLTSRTSPIRRLLGVDGNNLVYLSENDVISWSHYSSAP